MNSIYMKMFKYEKLLQNINHPIIKLEDMDYNTEIFKIPSIFPKAIEMMLEYNKLTYSDLGGFQDYFL